MLYRGAQPTAEGFENLRAFGVQAVVNFRSEPERIAAERRIVERLGMRYVSIPWRGRDKPSDAQVAEFLSFLQANPGTRIYVHCRRGAERTGLMVAAYRMTTQRWTPSQALAEMETFGFRGFWFRHLKRYVKEFPERFPQSLLSSPANPVTLAPAANPS
jgi:protein tyrosine/serine phosphatase